MSKEGTPELTKSWIFVNQGPDEDVQQIKDTSGVEEVIENEPHDSDTDSISVISEGGCSYRTDEEEFAPVETNEEEVSKESAISEKEPETVSAQSEIPPESEVVTLDENKAIEKLLYFGTSAVCAIILVGFSIAVQKYVHNASNLIKLEPDQHVIPHVQNLRTGNILKESHPNRFQLKRQNQLKSEEFEHKIAKLQNEEFNDKIAPSGEDNDPKVERNFKANYKLSKNKNAARCHKENCDVAEKPATENDEMPSDKFNQNAQGDDPQGYDKKVEKLKIKENYLREKEKFLIEKEHDLMKKEVKLNKEKQQYTKNKHDKNILEKGKKREESSEEFDSSEKNDKIKHKKRSKNNNKKKYQEDKKQEPHQKRVRISEDQGKKRNLSGQWYLNLHEARDNMRQKKRAHFKKNKAHWYFQWMVDRARLRVK